MTTKTGTKSKILDTAQSLMLKNGFHGVTVDKLIAAAGISKGSFFYHFRSKDDLPAALLERFIEHQGEQLQHALNTPRSDTQSPLEYALEVVDLTVEVFLQKYDGQPGCVMAAFSYQLMQQFPEVNDISRRALAGWQKGFTPLFLKAMSRPNEALAAELAELFMCVLQGANIVARIHSCPKAIQQATKHFKLHLQHICSQSELGNIRDK